MRQTSAERTFSRTKKNVESEGVESTHGSISVNRFPMFSYQSENSLVGHGVGT